MTRSNRFQARVAFTLAVMLAIAGLIGAVRVSVLPAAAQVVDSVVVSCDAPGADGSTTCVISAPEAEQLAVPAGDVCGTVVSSSGTFDGVSYVSASGDPSVVLTFSSPVAAGGGATYTVTTAGVPTAIGGAGIVCIEAPVAPAADETVIDLPDEETVVSDEPATEDPVEQPVEGDVPATDGEATDPGAGTEEPTEESTDGTGDGDETGTGEEPVAPANVIVDPETPTDPPAAPVAVTVTIMAYQCATDPGLVDPVTAGCAAVPDIQYAAADTSGDLGTATTNGSGVATFASTTGAAFLVEQVTNISGHRVIGDGRYEVLSLDGDTTITFVNVPQFEIGRLQLVAGLCPTSGESRTEFSIADQNNFGTASLNACGPNSGALYTVSSASLPGGSWVVRVEADGSWRGQVPAGVYTVTAPDGTVSPEIWVEEGAISVAVAISYVQQTPGTLLLEHYLCTEGTDGEYIQVNPGGAPDASCSPWQATVTVSEFGGGASDVITIAQNGSTPVDLRSGHYVATGPQGTSQDFNINAEATTVVRILTVATSGVLMVNAFQCPEGVTPADPETECTAGWGGQTFWLTPSGGSAVGVTVSGTGLAVVEDLTPGVYTLDGDNVCAVLSGGVDASGGFTISAGQTTGVAIYGCFAGDDGTGNPNPGGSGGNSNPPGDGTGWDGTTGHPIGQPGGGDGTGGDGTGVGGSNGTYGSNSVLNVTQLPNTGSGSGVSAYWWPMLLLTLAMGLAFTGLRLRPRTTRR